MKDDGFGVSEEEWAMLQASTISNANSHRPQNVSGKDIEEITSLEKSFHGNSKSPAGIARRLFEENAPVAATTIVELCKRGNTDRVRLDAAKYITDKVLGNEPIGHGGVSDPLMEAIARMTKVD